MKKNSFLNNFICIGLPMFVTGLVSGMIIMSISGVIYACNLGVI